jgi:HK97 family phage prohead protease
MSMPNNKHGSLYGGIEVKAEQASRMMFSGYVSTGVADLVDEVVEPSSFEKHLPAYKNNPVVCWNHNRDFPIGKCGDVEITDKGLYLHDVKLVKQIPIVQDMIWPCIQEGVLKQMSIGFLSLAGRMEGKYYHHKETYLLESSVVTVACNPTAEIDVVKRFGDMKTLDDLINAYEKGFLELPFEVRKHYFIDGPMNQIEKEIEQESMSTQKEKTHPLTPDFTDTTAIQLGQGEYEKYYDKDGEEVKKPYPSQKNYHTVNSLICAAKRESEGKTTYLFEVGVPTEKGFKYDWQKVALTMSRILGAKGGAHFNADEKSNIIVRLSEAYGLLEKSLPTVKCEEGSIPVDMLIAEELDKLEYKDVEFLEDEQFILMRTVLENDFKNIHNTGQSLKEKGEIPDDIVEVAAKSIYAMIEIFGFIETPEDAEMAGSLLRLVAAQPDDETPSVYHNDAPGEDEGTVDNNRVELLRLVRELTDDKLEETIN